VQASNAVQRGDAVSQGVNLVAHGPPGSSEFSVEVEGFLVQGAVFGDLSLEC
jgi:hypothetical protein